MLYLVGIFNFFTTPKVKKDLYDLTNISRAIIYFTTHDKLIYLLFLPFFILLHPSCCCCLVTKSCPIFCNPRDYSPPCSSAHEISQARILEWIAISFSRGSSQPKEWTCLCLLHFLHWQVDSLPLCLLKKSLHFFKFAHLPNAISM